MAVIIRNQQPKKRNPDGYGFDLGGEIDEG
jgi:hypothetical protein